MTSIDYARLYSNGLPDPAPKWAPFPPYYFIGGKLSVPLSNQGPRNNYKASKVSLQQLVLTLKQTEQSVLTEIDNDIITAKASYESVDATHQATLYAQDALDAEQKKLESGKSTSFVVLQLQNNLTSARSAEIAALATYNKALTALAKDEGTTLERRRIDVQVK